MGESAVEWSSDGPVDDEQVQYDNLHRSVGKAACEALRALSVNLEGLEADKHGWTSADSDSFHHLFEVDWLGTLMVPPLQTTLDNRLRADRNLRLLRNGLPFADGERWWLLTEAPDVVKAQPERNSPMFFNAIRQDDLELVTNGVRHRTTGHELLQRFWAWRREVGEYASGEGLQQARHALAGLVVLLTPTIDLPPDTELPDEYVV